MIGKLFMFIFNVLRTISLIIVIAFIALAVYLEKNKDVAEKLETALDRYEDIGSFSYDELPEEEEDAFGMMAMEIPPNMNPKKFKIKEEGNFHLLRPNQIMYVKRTNETSELILVTVEGDTIYPNQRIGELHRTLGKSPDFFSTKSDILNINYLRGIELLKDQEGNIAYHKKAVVMEDGTKFHLRKETVNQLNERIKELLF